MANYTLDSTSFFFILQVNAAICVWQPPFTNADRPLTTAMPKYADSLKKPGDLLQVISDQQNAVLITSEMSAQIVSEFHL